MPPFGFGGDDHSRPRPGCVTRPDSWRGDLGSAAARAASVGGGLGASASSAVWPSCVSPVANAGPPPPSAVESRLMPTTRGGGPFGRLGRRRRFHLGRRRQLLHDRLGLGRLGALLLGWRRRRRRRLAHLDRDRLLDAFALRGVAAADQEAQRDDADVDRRRAQQQQRDQAGASPEPRRRCSSGSCARCAGASACCVRAAMRRRASRRSACLRSTSGRRAGRSAQDHSQRRLFLGARSAHGITSRGSDSGDVGCAGAPAAPGGAGPRSTSSANVLMPFAFTRSMSSTTRP